MRIKTLIIELKNLLVSNTRAEGLDLISIMNINSQISQFFAAAYSQATLKQKEYLITLSKKSDYMISQALEGVKVLNLGKKGITDEIAETMAPYLKACKNLKSLILTDNQIGDDGITTILKSITSESFEDLPLEYNLISTKGVKEIANFMKEHKMMSCVALSFQSTEGNDKGLIETNEAIALAEAIKVNPKLKILGLSNMSIGNEGINVILEAIDLFGNYHLINSML